MSEEKRSVATDALATLGSIITVNEKRDAIHLAVEPAMARHHLRAGDHVGFVDGGFGICDEPVGIVDPFLDRQVKPGQYFWLIIYPRQISSLRHVWEHPKFPASYVDIPKASATPRNYLERMAAETGNTFEDLMSMFAENTFYSTDGDFHDYPPEAWEHYEAVSGKLLPAGQKSADIYFSCSC